jgi:hypothetical protein
MLEQEYRPDALFHLCQVTCRLSSNDCTLKSSFTSSNAALNFTGFLLASKGCAIGLQGCATRVDYVEEGVEKSQLPCSCHLSSLSLRAHHAGCLDSTGTKRDDRP